MKAKMEAVHAGVDDEIVKAQLPEIGFLRLPQIIGNRKQGIPPIIPVSKSGWYEGMKQGKFPKPVRLGDKARGWRVQDIRSLVEQMGGKDYVPNI